ncbi:MAG: hypothetical protein M0C28_37315 [Candidatus Moduliflexus flocculans]|nr:hypothetical protein [Candidatus Moduliflexus flocculans]
MPTYRLPYGHGFLDVRPRRGRRARATGRGRSSRPRPSPPRRPGGRGRGGPRGRGAAGLPRRRLRDRDQRPHAARAARPSLLPPLLRRLERAGVPDGRRALRHRHRDACRRCPRRSSATSCRPGSSARYRVDVARRARRRRSRARSARRSRGTPVCDQPRATAARELRVVVGAIEPHQFVGLLGRREERRHRPRRLRDHRHATTR